MVDRNVKLLEQVTKISAPATKVINNICVSTCDVQIDPSRGLWFRLFTPKADTTNSLPLILYFHGGGFLACGPDTKGFDDFCSHLAAKVPAVIASVNYRLAPEHKCPCQYEDAYDALKFIDEYTPAHTDLSSCFIGGDSAGGNIAHHLTVRAVKNAEQFNKVRIIGLMCVQPFFGGEERTESELRLAAASSIINLEVTDMMWREFLPEGADRNHPAVHVFGSIDDELKNLEFPPTLVIVGGNDPLQDWQKRYAEWLKICGKKVELTLYPDADHGFYLLPQGPQFDLLLQRLKDFIQK